MLSRIMARDGLSEAEARRRLDAQKEEDFFVSHADYVIVNNGDAGTLEQQVDVIARQLGCASEAAYPPPASAPPRPAFGAAAVRGCGFFALRRLFVLPYRDAVEREAARFSLPSSLVAGLILAESHFDKDAVSHAGAVGLMQLTPDTYHWLCFKLGHEEGDLSDVDTNLYYGCANMARFCRSFPTCLRRLPLTTAGPCRVRDWLARHALQQRRAHSFPCALP